MANSNFVVQNGLTVGPLTIDAATGSIQTTGTVNISGGLATSSITKNDSSITINDTGTGSNISIVIDGTTEHVLTSTLTTLNGNLLVNDVGYLQVPVGTTGQRPSSTANGMMRYNTTITSFEGYYAGAWSSLGGVKSVDGKAYIQAETSAGAGDDVLRFYAGDSGTSTQVMWASTSNVKVVPSTAATSTTSGALQVAGGAGIAGATYIGGLINVTGAATISGATTLNTVTAGSYQGIIGNATPAAGTFTSITGTSATVNGTIVASAINAPTIGNASASLTGTIQTASQTNITSVGNLTSVSVAGTSTLYGQTTIYNPIIPGANTAVNLGSTTAYWNNLYAAAGVFNGITVSAGKILPGSNAVVDIGSTSAWFNNIYGIATQAKYADLAENYLADKNYAPGTVLMFGGEQEVTVADTETTRVAGVVSTNPAHLMNGALSGPNVVPLALTGRVPCSVIGPVKKGDLMVSAGFGFAKVNNTPAIGTVIGKALQDYPIASKGIIEVVVGRF